MRYLALLFLLGACVQAPKVVEHKLINEYCGGELCVVTEEQPDQEVFYASTEYIGDLALTIRIESINPLVNKPQWDFQLKGPFQKTKLFVLPAIKDIKRDYDFRFDWRAGNTNSKHDDRVRYAIPFEKGKNL